MASPDYGRGFIRIIFLLQCTWLMLHCTEFPSPGITLANDESQRVGVTLCRARLTTVITPCVKDSGEAAMRALVWVLLLMSLLVVGCASTPVHTDGVTGSVAWRATDFQVTKAAVQGQPGERYAFTLVLSDRARTGVTFTALQRTISAPQVHTTSTARTGCWRLPPNGELGLPFSFTHYCPQAFDSCSGQRPSRRIGISS
jgi:hypothetical protein